MTSVGISLSAIIQLLLFSCLMASGQMLFKFTAGQVGAPGSFLETILGLVRVPTFWLACVLYGVATLFWLWILTRVPLSFAYPASALALVIVPLLSMLVFAERLPLTYWLGLALVLGGLYILTR